MKTTLSSRSRRRLAAALAVSAIVAGAGVTPARADDQPPAVQVAVVWSHTERADDGSGRVRISLGRHDATIVVARITLAPGARLSWDAHQGPVVVSVASGTLVSRQGLGCAERSYPAPDALVAHRNQSHSIRNPGPEHVVLLATFPGAYDDRFMPDRTVLDHCSTHGVDVIPGFSRYGDSIRWFTTR